MKFLKKEIEFWAAIGVNKKTISEAKDIIYKRKSKSQRRRQEKLNERIKNNPKELKSRTFSKYIFNDKKPFKDFCLTFIYKGNIKNKEYVDIFLNFFTTISLCSSLKINIKTSLNFISFELAYLDVKIGQNKECFNFFSTAFSNIDLNVIIEEMEKNISKNYNNISEQLADINDELNKSELYKKNNITIDMISEESFKKYIRQWSSHSLIPNINQLLHILEFISTKDNRVECFFYLLTLRILIYIKNNGYFDNETIKELISEYKTYKKNINKNMSNEKKIYEYYSNNRLINSNGTSYPKKFSLNGLKIKNKEQIEKLFFDMEYERIINEYKFEKSSDILIHINNLISYSLIIFIMAIKLENKALMKLSYKDLSNFLTLEYRGFKYDSNSFIKLLDKEKDLDNSIIKLNEYFSKNVDFSSI